MTRDRAVLLARVAVVAGAVLALELVCRAGLVSPLTLIPPSGMAARLWEMLAEGEVGPDLRYTAGTIVAAVLLSIALGFGLGVAVHAGPRLRGALDPLLAAYYSVPSFVFYPIFVAVFGLNVIPLVILGMAFGVPAMMMATMNGLDRVPRALLRTARVHRLDRLRTIREVVLPSAAPHLFAGVKLAIAYGFIGIIAGEFILASAGLGHAIARAYEGFDNPSMYALMLLVLLLVFAMNAVLNLWEGRIQARRTRA